MKTAVSLWALAMSLVGGLMLGAGTAVGYHTVVSDSGETALEPAQDPTVLGGEQQSACVEEMSAWIAQVASTMGSNAAYNEVLRQAALEFGAQSAEWRFIFDTSAEFILLSVREGRDAAAAYTREAVAVFCAANEGGS